MGLFGKSTSYWSHYKGEIIFVTVILILFASFVTLVLRVEDGSIISRTNALLDEDKPIYIANDGKDNAISDGVSEVMTSAPEGAIVQTPNAATSQDSVTHNNLESLTATLTPTSSNPDVLRNQPLTNSPTNRKEVGATSTLQVQITKSPTTTTPLPKLVITSPPTVGLESRTTNSPTSLSNNFTAPRMAFRTNYITFEDFLNDYDKQHGLMVAGSIPPKYFQFVCVSGRGCGGWGDRLKGIYNIIALGFMLDRAFLITNIESNEEMWKYLNVSSVAWNFSPPSKVAGKKAYGGNTMNSPCSALLNNILHLHLPVDSFEAHLEDYYLLSFRTNVDCTQEIFERFPNKTSQYKINLFQWKALVYQRYFKPTQLLEKAIIDTLEVKSLSEAYDSRVPTIGIHVRTGQGQNDYTPRFKGSNQELISRYITCTNQLITQLPTTTKIVTIFVAADIEDAVTMYLNKMNVTSTHMRQVKLITAKNVGLVGHIERFASPTNQLLRMHVEFEILRMSSVFITGISGFSRFAFKTRVHVMDASVSEYLAQNMCELVPLNEKDAHIPIG